MMRAGSASRASARGMTLLEVMVASGLASMLGILAYGVIMTTVEVQDDGLYMQNNFNAGRVAVERLRKELTMAFVSLHQAEDKRTKTLFVGEKDNLVFNTSAHEPLTRDSRTSDQLEVEYRLARVRSSYDSEVYTEALVRRVKYHIDDAPGRGGYEEILVEGVKEFELAYFDKFREDWTGEWDVTIDDAVEMRVRMKELQQLRDTVEGVRDDESTGVAGVVVADEAEKQIDEAELELLDGMILPSRVRITLVLEDRDGYTFPMQTQVEITMTEPLWY
ncbi:MAG: prepilin-type N-terminal cleavage/methylation domain-containing protein [Deltaproteobacteria bacterium]|nr:prepilin-type N-terminal cleavage/methylation domain-containing protein [Deltaproteobacteria bacterium]